MVRMAGLALLALLLMAPVAGASTFGVSGNTAVFSGDASADRVQLQRYDDTENSASWYIVTDDGGISPQSPCVRVTSTMAACRITTGRDYQLKTGGGADTVSLGAGVPRGTTDLGPGDDSFTGQAAADIVHGGDGNDMLRGAGGNDQLFGDGGNDLVAGQTGNDIVDGGAGDDQLEFAGAAMPADAGAGADDIHGGTGSDRLSYLDHTAGVSVSLDDKPGDGTSGENDNAHGDIETLVGSTFDDVLTGNDGSQSLFGNAGIDRADGLGGDDVVNGGTDDDELYGGAGNDRVEGSAGGDYLEGGAGEDIFEGDNVCEAEPCTGDSDFIQARDGQADTVNCGVGADTAIVDSLDVVAQDTQHGCERIDRSAAEAVTPPAGGVLGVSTTGLGVPRLSVLGARKLGRLQRGKLSIKVTCPGSCRVKARLISGRTVVASRSRTRLGPGTVIVRPKTNKKGRKLLKRRTKVTMTLAVDVTDDQGRTTTLARVLRFRR
jgi:RTX calcium-binding nonapeptide repeat (4 copies)